jgi:hypothetical protein
MQVKKKVHGYVRRYFKMGMRGLQFGFTRDRYISPAHHPLEGYFFTHDPPAGKI